MRTFNSKQSENVLKKTVLSVAIASACLYGAGVAAQTAMEANTTGQASSAVSATAGDHNVSTDTNTGARANVQGSADHNTIVDVLSETGSRNVQVSTETAVQASGTVRRAGENMVEASSDQASRSVSVDGSVSGTLDAVSAAHTEDGISLDVGAIGEGALSANVQPADIEGMVDVFADESTNAGAELQSSTSALVQTSVDSVTEAATSIRGAVDLQGELDAHADADVQESISSQVQSTAEATVDLATETATDTADTAIETSTEVAAEVRAEAESTIDNTQELISDTANSVEADADFAGELTSELTAGIGF